MKKIILIALGFVCLSGIFMNTVPFILEGITTGCSTEAVTQSLSGNAQMIVGHEQLCFDSSTVRFSLVMFLRIALLSTTLFFAWMFLRSRQMNHSN